VVSAGGGGIPVDLVVVGDLIGASAAQEQPVVGETPNLAARFQALAEPGAVVIESRTRRVSRFLALLPSRVLPRTRRRGRCCVRTPR